MVQAMQERTRAPIQILEANYVEDTQAIKKDAPAYLLSIAERPTGGQFRVRLYVRARDGRHIAIWQRRAVVGKFRAVDVSPLNPAYDFLAENGDIFGIARAAADRGAI